MLPEYMVPAYGIRLEGLPLTVNGKIDKKRLPPPVAVPTEQPDQYIPPRNDREAELAAILQEMFRTDKRVGMKQDFFGLGGNSLKAVALINRLKKVGFSVTIDDILNHPKTEDLARRLVVLRVP